ncbi:MAG: hypothetical protein ACREUJ_04120 [Burkholderiales bacterium]
MHHILVGFRIGALVVDIPAQRFEKRIQELLPQLSFVVMGVEISLALLFEALNESENFFGGGHSY